MLVLLSYLTHLKAKEEAGQQQCCPASALTRSLVLLVRPAACLSKSPSPLLRLTARLSPLRSPPLPALLPPLPARLLHCPVSICYAARVGPITFDPALPDVAL